MTNSLKPTTQRGGPAGAAQISKVVPDEVRAPDSKGVGVPLPKIKAEFEPNEAFADFDTTMAQAVAVLRSAVATAPFNGSIKDEQLAQLAAGKLAGKPLALGMESLQNVAKLLMSPEGQVFKAQLGAPINTAVLELAPRIGFPKAHEALLKTRLNTYAEALTGPLKGIDLTNRVKTLGQLHTLLESGVIGGQKLTVLVPDKAKRDAILDAAGMLTDNRRLFEAVGSMTGGQLTKLAAGTPVPVDDGNYKWTVGLPDVVATTLPVVPPPEPMVDVNDAQWKDKLLKLVDEYAEFIKSRKMVRAAVSVRFQLPWKDMPPPGSRST